MRGNSVRARRTAVVVAGVVLAASCGGSDGDDRGDRERETPAPAESVVPGPPGTYQVAEVTETFVDESRPTVAPDGAVNEPSRTLVTTIVHPTTEGPFPLIVLAHGQTGHPSKVSQLMQTWASAGYVVAAPAFPLTSNQAPVQVTGDYVHQPADVSFVIDEVLARGEDDGSLAGLVDGEHIAAAGLSLGGATVYGLAYHSCCRDKRVDAVLVMAGLVLPFDGTFEFPSVPLLVIHGNGDDRGRELYEMAKPPKFLVTIERPVHSQPFENPEDPADALVATVTVDFFRAYLYGQESALDDLAAAVTPGMATLEQER
jgi:dienelactone hydrolase